MISRQIILRYRAPDHVRFQLPPVLAMDQASTVLISALRKIDGIYRIRISGNKLSIRYREAFCGFEELARRLYDIVEELERQRRFPSAMEAVHRPLTVRLKETPAVKWARERVQDVRETLTAFGILARQGLKRGPKFLHDPKALAHEFANDVLVLYLIRIHWHRIVTQWIPNPIKHRYEWAAVFYMTYLLVRSRLPKK